MNLNVRNLDLKVKTDERGHAGFQHMVPNLITLAAMAAGLTSIQYALVGRWEAAVIAVLVAIILDGMDGATARLLDAASTFGAQLDNLSDFLAFGVAPAIILHVWILAESGKFGWMATVIYAAATALRLARFATEQAQRATWQRKFFSGVPSPAGAGLALFPLIIWLQYPEFFRQYAVWSPLIALWLMVVAALMISRLPTVSFKAIRISPKMSIPALGVGTLLIAALVNAPWLTLSAAGVTYIASLPFTALRYRVVAREQAEIVILGNGENI